jgi:hypothetical protein
VKATKKKQIIKRNKKEEVHRKQKAKGGEIKLLHEKIQQQKKSRKEYRGV